MNGKILIAGGGHGGLAAAYHLAKKGADVTVLEMNSRYNMGWDQPDSVNLQCFEAADIPVPQDYVVKRTPITLCVGDGITPNISQVVPEDGYTVMIERKILCQHLVQLAMDAGANFIFNTKIEKPVLLGGRVCGVQTDKGTFYADLVIDACGVHSPLRTNLPDKLHIEQNVKPFDILHTYRAFYNKIPDCPQTEPYKVYVFVNGTVGLQWLITNEEDTDVLIGRFDEYSDADTVIATQKMMAENPQLGDTLLRGGHVVDIPVRQPLSVLVADGYAAIGDSAFMTYSVKGSGVGYAMQAGRILAETVMADTESFYSAKQLWNYQTQFYKEIGKNAAIIALGKVLMNKLTTEDVAFLLREDIINQKIMDATATENGLVDLLAQSGVSVIKDKMVRFFDNKELRSKVLNMTVWIARLLPILAAMPDKYDRDEVKKWAYKYDGFYDSIRADDVDAVIDDELI